MSLSRSNLIILYREGGGGGNLEWKCGCWWEYYDEFPCRLHVCKTHQRKYNCQPVLRVEIFDESRL